MAVAVMEVGIVRVLVAQGLVAMPVRMRLADRPLMHVPMMLVMHMAVLMLHRVVHMVVLMPFGKMQP